MAQPVGGQPRQPTSVVMRPDLVNIAWVAKKLDVSPRYVRRLVAEKRLAYVKVGRLVRFERDEVYRFIRERRVAPGH